MSPRTPSWQTWVLSFSMVLLIAVAGYAFNAIDKRMVVTEARVSVVERDGLNRAERITTLEAQQRGTVDELKKLNDNINLLIRMHMEPQNAARIAKEAQK